MVSRIGWLGRIACHEGGGAIKDRTFHSHFKRTNNYWRKDGVVIYNFGRYMPRNLFHQLTAVWAVPFYPGTQATDPFWKCRRWVDSINECWKSGLQPGHTIVCDESMITWTGRAMPGFMKVGRKPKPLGRKMKTVADGQSKIMLHMEVQEGAAAMALKTYAREYGPACANTMRMTEAWKGSGRIVLGDSWFGSSKAAVQLWKRGLYSILNVKTGHSNFPKKALFAALGPRGSHVAFAGEARTSVGTCNLFTVAHQSKQPMLLVSTCSTTLAGPDQVKTWLSTNAQGVEEEHRKVTAQREVTAIYRKESGVIDCNNHKRQGAKVALSDAWGTKDAAVRESSECMSICLTNAHLAKVFFADDKDSQDLFIEGLAVEILSSPLVASEKALGSFLPPLPGLAHDMRQHEKQKKCSYCKKNCGYYCATCSPPGGHRINVCSFAVDRDCWNRHHGGEAPVVSRAGRPRKRSRS
eukprot:jgi/Mesvir1/19198/Mv25274-RA.1